MFTKLLFLLLALPCAAQNPLFFQSAFNVAPQAGTPTFSPVAGTYVGTKNVTITASTGGVICYNTTGSPATNGTTGCTTGTLYSTAVAVTTSETLYAVAGGTGYRDSNVGSAAYVITAPTLPSLVQTPKTCTTTPCAPTSTITAGSTVILVIDAGTTNTGDASAVTGNVSGAYTHATACNYYTSSGASAMDAWYKIGAGADTSITVTEGHPLTYMGVYEVAHAGTFNGCLTANNTSATAVSSGPSYASGADQFVVQEVNGISIDTINSGALPSTGAWTIQTGTSMQQAYAIPASSGTYQYIGNNHSGSSHTSTGISISFSN